MHGIYMGITQGLGMQSVMRDLGFHYGISMHTDATAAIGICRRRGMGRIRHLDVTDLWSQEKVRSGTVKLHKMAGAENPAECMTKCAQGEILEKMIAKIHDVSMANGHQLYLSEDS